MKRVPEPRSRAQSRRQLNRRHVLGMGAGAALAVPAARFGGAGGRGVAAQQGEGVMMPDALGREYLAYPETSGTVQFSNCWGGARVPLIEQWIEDFNAIYPNIRVQSDLSECSALAEQQVASIAGGAPANVMMIKSDNIAFFAEQDALLPLNDLMERDNVEADWFYPGEFAARTWQDVAYGLPNVTAGALHLLFVNQGLLEEIGVDPETPIATWQDLMALVEPAKEAGLLVMDPAKISTGMTGHQVFTYANGGRYWDDDLTTILWNEPAGVEAAEWMLEFVQAQAGSYENLAIAADRKNVIQPEDWAPEQYVAMINGSWTFFQLAEKAPHIDYAAYTFPRNADNPDSLGYTPTTGGWMFGIAAAGEDHDAAWEWIKFTTASDNACSFVQAQNRPSPVQSCNENPELGAGNPFWDVVTEDLATNIAVPVTSIHPQFVQIWFDMEDAILFEVMPPEEALNTFAEDAQELLDEWNAERA